ncbi:MAG: hypothetical protein EHM49_02515 [Deltaproteobacteria bacterium]|nr:MAG: hypothetical protein EHM49_02515 [Deltaproteobacteria bacterium]
MPDKTWYTSVTLWGGIVMAAAFIASFFGFSMSADEQAQLVQLLTTIATAVGGLVGLIMVIIGRRKTGAEIKLLRQDVKMARLGVATSPAKESWIEVSNKIIGEDATTLFSTGIFFTTAEGKAILSAIKAGAQSEKGKLLLAQYQKMSETKTG